MNKKLFMAIAVPVVLGGTVFGAKDALIDSAIRNRSQKILQRFHYDLLSDGKLHVFAVGTGTPIANPRRTQSSIAILADGVFVLIDTGAGSAQKTDLMGLPLSKLSAVFLTHFHSDHYADLPLIANTSWRFGRAQPLPVYGPTGTTEIVDALNVAFRKDREYRYANQKSSLASPKQTATIGHDVRIADPAGRMLVRKFPNGLSVHAFLVEHAPVVPAFGYRIEYKNRVIVISGDTTATENLVRHGKGADLLFHEVFNKSLTNRMLRVTADLDHNPSSRRMRGLARDVQHYHSSPTDAARVAAGAGVRRLVFTHIDPPLGSFFVRNLVTLPHLMEGVAAIYDGDIVIAEDGMHFELDPK